MLDLNTMFHRTIKGVCGCVSDIDDDFKRELAELVPLLLAPEQLVEKEIGGNKVTCRDLVEYFKVLQDFIKIQLFSHCHIRNK